MKICYDDKHFYFEWQSTRDINANKSICYLSCTFKPKIIKRYTRNAHYNPSVRIVKLASNTTYIVSTNFIHKWQDLQFKVDSERQIFFFFFFLRNFSWQSYLLSGFLPQICWEEIAKEILFVFCFNVRPGSRTTASQHTTY